jgi:hypothetical protein
MNDEHDRSGGRDDDEEAYLRSAQNWDRRRAERSDEQWWREDHLSGPAGSQLDEAFKTLVNGCRCDVGRMLSDLREIEDLSSGHEFYSRRNLPTIIHQIRRLARDLWGIEQSPVGHLVPSELLISSEKLRKYADALDKARHATSRTSRPQQAKRIGQQLAYVDTRVREHGDIGKKGADAALAVLLTVMTREKWTAAGLRMARSRVNKKVGRKRVKRDPRRPFRPLRGSRAKPRERRLVPLDVYRREVEREEEDNSEAEPVGENAETKSEDSDD